MSVQHVWRERREYSNGVETYETQCRRVAYRQRDDHVPTKHDLTGATCLHCIRAVQSWALWYARENTVIAEEATNALARVRIQRKIRRNRNARRREE